MNSSTVGGVISIESHTKQIKLLNDYILSLEKKVAEKKEENVSKHNFSDEIRKINEENNKLRNQNAQLRYNIYKYEETGKKVVVSDQEAFGLKALLEKERKDKNQIIAQNQLIAQHLQNCEAHLQAAEGEILNRTQVFQRDMKLLNAELQGLRNQLSKLSTQLTTLREEKIYFEVKLRETEVNLSEAIKSKNQAILKLNQTHQQLKAKLSEQVTFSNNKKDNHNGQVRDLVNQLNQSRGEMVNAKKQVYELKALLQNKVEELQAVYSKLGYKTQELQNSVRVNNQQKSNLIRLIKRLQQQKKILQSVNNTVKGDVNEQAKLREQLIKRNEALSYDLTQVSKQLAQVRGQFQNMFYLKQQIELKMQTLNNEFINMRLTKDETQVKRKEMQQTNQALLKDFFSQKNYFQFSIKTLQQALEKKNKQIIELQEKLNQLQNQLLLFRNTSDTSSKQFLNYRNAKESQILHLNAKINESAKQQSIISEALEALRQQLQISQKRKEGELLESSNRFKELQKEHLNLKDSYEVLTREYYTFQKKTEADIYTLNQRIKEQSKKIEKKDSKIAQLQAEIKQIERLSHSSRKNLDESQRQEMERIRIRFQRQNTSLNQFFNEEKARSEQLAAQKKLGLIQIQQLQAQIKSFKEEFKAKEKTLSQSIKYLERERDDLLQQVKALSFSVTLTSQSKSSQELQIQVIKRNIIHLQGYSNQQRKNIDSLNKLLSEKQLEIQSLENSNAMLRKQVIASINNEEVSRKEVLEVRSKSKATSGVSGIATSRVRGSHSRKTTFSQLPPKQSARFAESQVAVVQTRKNSFQRKKSNNSGVMIDEMSLLSSTQARGYDTFSMQTRQI